MNTTNMGRPAVLGLLLLAGLAAPASARMVKDTFGNVGYEGVAECDTAVEEGRASFFATPFIRKPPLLRPGEASVKPMTLAEVVIPQSVVDLKGFRSVRYELGACDMGPMGQGGREGVSTELQGKYVPFSPTLPVNVYFDSADRPVRVSLRYSDSGFSGNFPRPVAARVIPPAPVPYVPPRMAARPAAAAPAASPLTAAGAAPAPAPAPTQASEPGAATTPAPSVPPASIRSAVASAAGDVDTRSLLIGGGIVAGLGLVISALGDSGTPGTSGTSGTTGTR